MSSTETIKLPPNWFVKQSRRYPGRLYYVNVVTRETTWIPPGEQGEPTGAKKFKTRRADNTPQKRKVKGAGGPNLAAGRDVIKEMADAKCTSGSTSGIKPNVQSIPQKRTRSKPYDGKQVSGPTNRSCPGPSLPVHGQGRIDSSEKVLTNVGNLAQSKTSHKSRKILKAISRVSKKNSQVNESSEPGGKGEISKEKADTCKKRKGVIISTEGDHGSSSMPPQPKTPKIVVEDPKSITQASANDNAVHARVQSRTLPVLGKKARKRKNKKIGKNTPAAPTSTALNLTPNTTDASETKEIRSATVSSPIGRTQDLEPKSKALSLRHAHISEQQDSVRLSSCNKSHADPSCVAGSTQSDSTESVAIIMSSQVSETDMDVDVEPSLISDIYIIIDTNVLIQNIKAIDDLKDQVLSELGRPTLVVPWVVIQELDSLKNDKSLNCPALRTQLLARHAVNYLNQCLRSKHPRVIGQTPAEDRTTCSSLIKVECNDDRVMNCCFQWKAKYSEAEIILLTLDTNLRNKAMVSGITTYNLETLLARIDAGTSLTNRNNDEEEKQVSTPNRPSEQPTKDIALTAQTWSDRVPLKQKNEEQEGQTAVPKKPPEQVMRELTDEIFCELKTVLKPVLSTYLIWEMRKVYDDLWEQIVYKKPPWTLLDLLENFNKHWIAVFGMLTPRIDKVYLLSLQSYFKLGVGGSCYQIGEVKQLISDAKAFLKALRASTRARGDESSEHVEDKLSVLYGVAHDVETGARRPAALAELLRPDGIMDVKDHIEEQQKVPPQTVLADVRNIFQIAWENILFCKDHLDTNMLSADDRKRSEFVSFLTKLVPALIALDASYSRMMTFSVADASAHPKVFYEVCEALDRVAAVVYIQPWVSMQPSWLQTFYIAEGCREVLQNGYQQLRDFLLGLEKCWSQLTPLEQALLTKQPQ